MQASLDEALAFMREVFELEVVVERAKLTEPSQKIFELQLGALVELRKLGAPAKASYRAAYDAIVL